jgi:hypothetical protein
MSSSSERIVQVIGLGLPEFLFELMLGAQSRFEPIPSGKQPAVASKRGIAHRIPRLILQDGRCHFP